MSIDELDKKVALWADRYYLSPYQLRTDSALMILILQEADKNEIVAYLKEEYADHFAEIEEED